MSKLEAMHAKGPIFVVGSPRSGTSILTWCLGQHPDILPQEESGWMGRLAIDLGVGYGLGSQFGERSQLSALGVDRDRFFEAFGETIDAIVCRHRAQLERNCRHVAERNPILADTSFSVSRSNAELKSRWVDGTPEYSFHICGLRKLFPNAKFVHIVRDVQSVVNSMLHFKPGVTSGLFKDEQHAYEYWLNTVEACVRAEQALGARVMYRLRYEDLVNQPEQTLRGVLTFLGEPYAPACAEPLARRINSSEVPKGFTSHDPATDPRMVERAACLSDQLRQPYEGNRPLPAARTAFEAEFNKQISFAGGLDAEYALAQQKVTLLSKRLSLCGLVLAGNLVCALGGMFLEEAHLAGWSRLWLALSLAALGVYAGIRRAGLAHLFARLSGKLGLRFAAPREQEDACSYVDGRSSMVRMSRKGGAGF